VINNVTKHSGYWKQEPNSEALSTSKSQRTPDVTCNTAVKRDTKMKRQMQIESSRDEMFRKPAKHKLFE
jgi:hypothetical protein